MSKPFQSVRWDGAASAVMLLDQKVLPHTIQYKTCTTTAAVSEAIIDMTVRGAPAIGIAAAYGVVIAAIEAKKNGLSATDFVKHIETAITFLRQSRPTAVNLFWALDRMQRALMNSTAAFAGGASNPTAVSSAALYKVIAALEEESHAIFNEDIQTNLAIAKNGFELIPDEANIIHHCNTGSLATADYGTALGIIRYAHEQGKKIHVYLDETRPRMQGASLSAFELQQFGIPHTVIVDSASGFLMKKKKISLCVVGCDRVCANGDTANKIGTYNLSIVASAHNVPFYVAAPTSTIDPNTKKGSEIEIEERSGQEITQISGVKISPNNTATWNPAFDVTPGALISAIITEKQIFRGPYSF